MSGDVFSASSSILNAFPSHAKYRDIFLRALRALTCPRQRIPLLPEFRYLCLDDY